MNDKELADKVVALGVGKFLPAKLGKIHLRSEDGYSIGFLDSSVSEFVRDWRVAGALMEKVDSCYPEKLIDERWQVQASMNAMPTEWLVNKSLPRAIIEACCEALE